MTNPYTNIKIRSFFDGGLSLDFKDRNNKNKFMRVMYSAIAESSNFLASQLANKGYVLLDWEKNRNSFINYLMSAKAPVKKKAK